MNLQNKNVGVVGFGITGKQSCLFLLENGARVTLYDEAEIEKINSPEFEECKKNKNFKYFLGKGSMEKVEKHNLLVMSAGVSPTSLFFQKENVKDVEKIIDISLFIKNIENLSGHGKLIGVTGSNGKSTTVSVAHHILKDFYPNPVLCGNIGKSPLEFLRQGKIDEVSPIIMELSSGMLFHLKDGEGCDYSIITNISENHIDHHGSMDDYVDAKLSIAKPNSVLIFNLDDEGAQKYFLPKIKNHKNIYGVFKKKLSDEEDFFYKDLNSSVQKRLFGKELKTKLIGEHNFYNVSQSLCLIDLMFLDLEKAKKNLADFSGLEHRLEFVKKINDVNFINDSRSTTPDATLKALCSFEEKKKINLILGGDDKGVSYDSLEDEFVKKVKNILILRGGTDEKFQKLAEDSGIPFYFLKNMNDAVKKAFEYSVSGDTVLLSSGASSHNLYKNFEERGTDFKKIVLGL